MLKVGLTGGIGSGKTTVSKILESLGYTVFNSDLEAKIISDTHPEVRKELSALCGEEIYNEEGLNRPLLAQQIFSNEELRQKVNEIIHPRVRLAFDQRCETETKNLIFNEAAILIETGAYKQFDFLILVTAPQEIRAQRVSERDGVSIANVKKRMNIQWDDEKKKKYADFIIVNDNESPVLVQVEKIVAQLSSS